MGFLRGIIADARSGGSRPAIDGNKPSAVESGSSWNTPSAGSIEPGETGFQGSRSEPGLIDSGTASSTTYQDPSVFSAPATETGRPSRADQITTENVISVVQHVGSQSPVPLGNVQRKKAGMWEGSSAENGFDSGAESSMVYREPSVFSAPSAETDVFSRSDTVSSRIEFPTNPYPARIGSSNQDEMTSETTVTEDEFRRPDIQGIASTAVEEAPTFTRTRPERQTRPFAGSPASTKPVIGPGIAAAITALDRKKSVRAASEREGTSTSRFSSSTTLPRRERTLIGPLLHDADVLRMTDNREMQHVGQPESVAAQVAPGPIPVPERRLRPAAHYESTATTEPSRQPARPRDERHVKEAAEATAIVSSISTTRRQLSAKRTENEGKAGAPRVEAEVHQRETVSLAGKKHMGTQAELAVRRPARQDRGWSAGVPQPVQRTPEVKIGQVDVFIEAPRNAAASDRGSPRAQNTLSSRHYLRRI